MTSTRRVRRLALVALAGFALTACGSGFDAQTSQVRTFSEGANREVDDTLLVRNVYIAPPPEEEGFHAEGDDARVYGVLVNQGSEDDRLVSVESPAASSVTFFAGGDPEAGVSEQTENFLEYAPEDAEQREGGPDTRTVPEGGDGQEIDGLDIPANSTAEILPGTGYLLLEGLTERLYPGQVVPMTMQFERAGSITFDVYVHVLGEPYPREPVVEEESEH